MNQKKKNFITPIALFVTFIVFTLLVIFVDVQAVGPQSSSVGLATINKGFHDIIGSAFHLYDPSLETGYSTLLYSITKYTGYLCILLAFAFAVYALYKEYSSKKDIKKIKRSTLGLFPYFIVLGILYVLFEIIVINYRPVIVDVADGLEASYPSSHTLLATGLMLAIVSNAHRVIKNALWEKIVVISMTVISCITILGRLFCGVHWLTDIIAALILGNAAFSLYKALVSKK